MEVDVGETTPAKIGHYTIVSELGRGGMGVVYKAHEESLNRFVAIKVLGAHLAEDATFVARFMREARAAAALSHPNIIQIFFIGEDEGRHYFVMEYVSGKSLLAMVREEGRIDNPRASQYMLQAANGLAAAHDKNLLHRDIKPANLMVDERGLLKIADFGLALPQDAATRLTATGMLMGTPGYLSPEQCRGEAVDRRTDIYSLGVTFFELLSGRTPFHADSPLALLRLILEQEPPDIASLSRTVDPETSRIVHRMIAKDPARRYQDCHELAADLERWLAGSGARVAPAGVAGMVGAAPAPAAAGGDERTTRMPGPSEAPGAASGAAAAAGAPSAPPATAVSAGGPDAPHAVASPPPPLTVPADVAPSALAPVPQAAVAPLAAPQGARRSRAPLVALGIVVVLLAAMGASAFFLLRSPLVRRYLPWLSRPGAAAVAGSTTPAAAEPPSPATAEPAPAPEGGAAPAGEGHEAAAASGAPATAGMSPGAGSVPGVTGSAVSRQARRGGSIRAGSAAGTASDSQPAPPVERAAAPAPARAAVAGRVAVAVVGDQPLAGAVADLLQSELSSRGLQPVDAASLPGGEDLLRGRGAPTAGELIRALAASDAAELVVARIEPAGERTLSYMGRHDVAYSARVTLTCFDLTTGRSRGSSPGATVEYTSLGVAGAAEKALSAALTEIGRQAR
jgi:eukaryotic-like serine/threonine-protein kinase